MLKCIPGFPGYLAGEDGSIWTRRLTNGRSPVVKQIKANGLYKKKLTLNSSGYLYTSLRISGPPPKTVIKPVHYLICLTFHGTRPGKSQIRHLDGISTNNVVGNLKYGSASENQIDRVMHGNHWNAKLTPSEVRAIRARYIKLKNYAAVAREFNITRQNVRRICERKSWKRI